MSFLSMFMRIDRRFMGKCFGQMQELGIYPGQIPVLGLLAYKDGLSQREIAEHLRIKPPTVNVTVQRLEKAGFLFRKADEKDQRVSRIYLTEKGKQAKERGMKRVEENEKILFDGFSDAELCLLRRFLEQITANIDKIPGSSGKNDTKKARQQK
ncbi:MarR family winged helix-turn-helix transcriptional regulator [Blautia sp.]|uniref:MarR family winged helix-turn-helix transcriptional regulator n=1 Tax=Blautia sp. TaxID=1955243 RepID=UPI003A942F52